MKLHEILKLKDLTNGGRFLVDKYGEFGAYYDASTLGDVLGLSDLDYDWMEAVNKTGYFKFIQLRSWMCTDTMVGLTLITMHDRPVLLKYQNGRKSDPQWTFVDSETHKMVFDCFMECRPVTHKPVVKYLTDDENERLMYLECGDKTKDRDISNSYD